jgi:DNA-binding NarL/FixJ family response regulator
MQEQAQETIRNQEDIPLSIKRSAWILFQHELRQTNPATGKQFTARKALSNVLKWMAGQKARQNFRQLTPKERELIGLLVEGLTQKQMAFELGCELVTVKRHFSRIRRKIGVISTYQVVAVAIARGWVNAPKMDE